MESTSSIAASGTLDDHLAQKRYRTSVADRVLKAIAAYVELNTPANDDLTVEVYVGEVLVTRFPPGLIRSSGGAIQAEDWLPLNVGIPKGVPVTVKVINNDSGGAHSAKVALAIDGF